MEINPDRLPEFLGALLPELAGPQTSAAFWFYRPVVLPVAAAPLPQGQASPFAGSGSFLAGEGYLLHLAASTAAALAAFFARDLDALSALIHLEVECAGQLQFRSYDSFSVNLPGPALTDEWLAGLLEQGILIPG